MLGANNRLKIQLFPFNTNLVSLLEEGVAYRIIDVYNLQHLQPAEILKNSPAVIFPDRVAENLPQEIAMWLHDYLEQGGYSLIFPFSPNTTLFPTFRHPCTKTVPVIRQQFPITRSLSQNTRYS
jgi:hypothetical protein